jgi:hypothetical protein
MIFGSAGSSGYVVENSVWFDGSADALSFVTSSGNRRKVTLSYWYKGQVDASNNQCIASINAGGAWPGMDHYIKSGVANAENEFHHYNGSGYNWQLTSSAKERDPTAWQHIVYAVDTEHDTASSRVRIYKNGAEITAWGTESNPSEDFDIAAANYTVAFSRYSLANDYFYGYLAECIYIDGTQYAASDFGEYDANGVWVPTDPSGLTFGTNGAWLDFAVAPGTGNGAGTDVSGNGNHFTETSMTAAQQVTDTCTDDADNDIANFANINAITPTAITLSEGNQRCAGTDQKLVGNIAVTRGSGVKLVVEFEIVNVANWTHLGMIGLGNGSLAEQYWDNDGTWRLNYNSAGNFQFGGTDSSAPASYTTGDFIRMEADFDGDSLEFFKNNVSQGTITISTTYDQWVWGSWLQGSSPTGDIRINTGQRAFENTPTSGFVGWGTANLAAPTVTNSSDFFKTVLYTGNGTAIGSGGKAVTGVGFQPDFVWIKNRDAADSHMLFDASRGVTKYISSDTTAASATDTESLSTFDSDGFTVGNNVAVNTNTEDYVAFCLKAGGAGSSNTTGSINTTKTSVATHGGFSISTYTGTAANATVGHGLSRVPEVIITKNLADTDNWAVYHSGNTSAPETEYLVLNLAGPTADDSTYWNDTAPTSSVFSVGSVTNTNGSSDAMVAYCFAKTPGLIGIGTYTGNNAANGFYVVVDDGASGFLPAWVMLKRLEDGYSWHIHNSAMSPYNPVGEGLNANDSSGEASWGYPLDFTANGFKLRTTNGGYNGSATYIYLAFAENPFGGSGVAQARAR